MLDIKNVHKTFFAGTVNERVALQDINLTLARRRIRHGHRQQRRR